MVRLVREAGSIISGKETRFGHPPLMLSCLREVNLSKPHLNKIGEMLRSQIKSDVMLVGKPCFGNFTMPGHSHIFNS